MRKRLRIYKRMLKELKRRVKVRYTRNGLCLILEILRVDSNINHYPELLWVKPQQYIGSYWWHPFDVKTRILAVQTVITLTEIEIRNSTVIGRFFFNLEKAIISILNSKTQEILKDRKFREFMMLK